MLHAFDDPGTNRTIARPDWMALLSRAPLALLEAGLGERTPAGLQWLRKPETGLYMVQARAGGTGERFNLGELTVTRCALRLAPESGPVGVAYVAGRSHRQARLAAIADALLQDPRHRARLETAVLNPVRQHLLRQQAIRAARTQSTKVDFLTVAREADGAGAVDEGEDA